MGYTGVLVSGESGEKIKPLTVKWRNVENGPK